LPLNVRRADGSHAFRSIESNIVQVRITQPEGAEAKVFETIRRPEFLYFLQSGSMEPGHEKTAIEAARLYPSTHGTGYDAPVRRALQQEYERRRGRMSFEQAQADPDVTEIRSALGIFEPLPGPFPDDRRLDVEIRFHFVEPISFEDKVAEFSRASRVPLRIDPALVRPGPSTSIKVTKPLRLMMKFMAETANAVWVREGEVYWLVPAGETLPPHVRKRLPEN
jgi:hypothetical protein